MSKLKTDDDLKLKLIQLVRGDGVSISVAASQLGVAQRTAYEFFAKEKKWMKEWWDAYEERPVYQSKFRPSVERLEEIVKIGEDLLINTQFDENKVFTEWKTMSKKPQKILVIADTQCKPTESLEYMSWIGKYINDKKPDVIVHIGDHYDFPSLSSYDKGKKSFEGRRLKDDIEAGNEGMRLLLREFKFDDYNPRMVFCMGNHEARFDRLAEEQPELEGLVGADSLPLTRMGWEVHPFLKPVDISGIYFVHYLANPFTGKPYCGTALNQLKTVGRSFVVGHKQCLDVAIRNTLDGKQQIGIINGACYPFEEHYKGFQGNSHFRGLTMLHEVEDGSALPMFVSLDYLQKRYAE